MTADIGTLHSSLHGVVPLSVIMLKVGAPLNAAYFLLFCSRRV
jgi:hypothetical protein